MLITKNKSRNAMSCEDVRALFVYEKGFLYWIKKDGSKGMRAGRLSSISGYSEVRSRGKTYKVHNLVWVWHGNILLDGHEVDHINDNRNDNRIENLQLLTVAENVRKQQRVQNPKGCYFYVPNRKKWRAKLATKQLGNFNTEQEAKEALEAARQNHKKSAF